MPRDEFICVLILQVVKQTVMTVVYGVTKYGAQLQILRQLQDLDDFPQQHAHIAASYLVQKVFFRYLIFRIVGIGLLLQQSVSFCFLINFDIPIGSIDCGLSIQLWFHITRVRIFIKVFRTASWDVVYIIWA